MGNRHKWVYDGFVDREKVFGDIPHEYIHAFDKGDQRLMNKFAKDLFVGKIR